MWCTMIVVVSAIITRGAMWNKESGDLWMVNRNNPEPAPIPVGFDHQILSSLLDFSVSIASPRAQAAMRVKYICTEEAMLFGTR